MQHDPTLIIFPVCYPLIDLVVGVDKYGPARDIAAMVRARPLCTKITPESSGMAMAITSLGCREPLARVDVLQERVRQGGSRLVSLENVQNTVTYQW